jgi:hypothetical protein
VNLARQKVEPDQCLDVELPALELGEEVRPTRDEHRARSKVGGHPRGLARGRGTQVLKSRQAQH